MFTLCLLTELFCDALLLFVSIINMIVELLRPLLRGVALLFLWTLQGILRLVAWVADR